VREVRFTAQVGPARLPSVATSVDDVLRALRLAAACPDDPDDSGSVNLLDHALQCAAIVAEAYPDDLELQVAALVHDVGLVMDPTDRRDHSRNGAHYVAVVLGSRVAEIVRLHDEALRYLLTTLPGYGALLGRESIRTVTACGGPLEPAEMGQFLSSPWARDALALTRADELARSPGLAIGSLEQWTPALTQVAEAVAAGSRRAAS
jgi:predicted HD phosphohydrolase